mmetsp:Transcript_8950/g.19748  ORF Transcript_8950/g.19748 Transcript_8950/m.19748 type:complete len:125 (+) Transcript_8950:32-406(+)
MSNPVPRLPRLPCSSSTPALHSGEASGARQSAVSESRTSMPSLRDAPLGPQAIYRGTNMRYGSFYKNPPPLERLYPSRKTPPCQFSRSIGFAGPSGFFRNLSLDTSTDRLRHHKAQADWLLKAS